MLSKSKSILFSVFQKSIKLLWGKGIGQIPGVYAIHSFLFQILLPNKKTIEVEGSKMYMNPDKLPQSYIKTFQSYILFRNWEELTTEAFKKAVIEGNIVLDIGANIGFFTLLAARLVGKKGKVYAFEPEPINYNLLTKNIELNGYNNIIPLQKAVSNVNGMVTLFLDNKDTGAHTIRQCQDNKEFVEVESVTLDEFFKNEKHPIDVIKMDIEGAEMAAFLGMERIIRENDNLKIFVEFYPTAIREMGDSPDEFVHKLLEDYRFSILVIDDYTKNKKYLRINNVDELMNFVKGKLTVNLFLERTGKWTQY